MDTKIKPFESVPNLLANQAWPQPGTTSPYIVLYQNNQDNIHKFEISAFSIYSNEFHFRLLIKYSFYIYDNNKQGK